MKQLILASGSPRRRELLSLYTTDFTVCASDFDESAVQAARAWAAGVIRMPLARQAILSCHALARELTAPGDIARCHAVAQGCSVVHTTGHAMGLPVYELTAVVRERGLENCREAVERRSREYSDRLLYWERHPEEYSGPWAAFLR